MQIMYVFPKRCTTKKLTKDCSHTSTFEHPASFCCLCSVTCAIWTIFWPLVTPVHIKAVIVAGNKK